MRYYHSKLKSGRILSNGWGDFTIITLNVNYELFKKALTAALVTEIEKFTYKVN